MITKKIKIITIATISTMLITGCSAGKGDDVIATVNGSDITVDYYKKTLELKKENLKQTYGDGILEESTKEGINVEQKLKEDTLNEIINSYVIYEKAKEENLLATEEEIKSAVELQNEVINLSKNKEYLVEEVGIEDTYLKESQDKYWTSVSYEYDYTNHVNINEDEIKEYYEANKDDFYEEQVRVSHIQISNKDENGQIISSSMLSNEEKAEAREKANSLLDEINNGANFEELAKENSDCTSSEIGGDLGYFGRNTMVERFEYAAFKLDIGEISDIVETEYGYHIIKSIDKKEELSPFNAAEDLVELKILDERYNKHVEDMIKDSNIEKNEKIIDELMSM